MGFRWVTSSSPCLILVTRVERSLLKSASGARKFISVLDGMGMKLQSKLNGCMSVKTKLFKRLQSVGGVGNLPPLIYNNNILPYSNTFRYLGMLFDKNLDLRSATEGTLKPCVAGIMMACIRTFAHQHQLAHRPHVHVIPSGMFVSQIWATSHLRQGREMDNYIQRSYRNFQSPFRDSYHSLSSPLWSVG
eukprot:1152837-Pelagomonas_calceolata.AAC.1